jgi:hypothetical protein
VADDELTSAVIVVVLDPSTSYCPSPPMLILLCLGSDRTGRKQGSEYLLSNDIRVMTGLRLE